MNKHALSVLEFPEFLEMLSEYAVAPPAADFLRVLHPAAGKKARNQPLWQQAQAMRGNATIDPPRHTFADPTPLLKRIAPENAAPAADEWTQLRELLDHSCAVRKFLHGSACAEFSQLRKLGERLADFAPLRETMDRIFDDQGSIRDQASPALAAIRRQIVGDSQSINRRLTRLARELADEGVLQEAYVAQRNGRHVLPVCRERRSSLPGIVHDQSQSGRTLFVEPAELVEPGNQLTRAHLAERDEIRRILIALAAQVRPLTPEITQTFQAMIHYEVAMAVSEWAGDYHCTFPQLGDTMNLRRARHPLLERQFRRHHRANQLVPLNLQLSPETRTLAITGSNAGGKTLALKTVGLLSLMAHAGLPIPAAAGSTLPRFQHIFADIGDEQSLAQNLSTFSAHMARIVEILDQAGNGTALVLLDELGAGTDPVEGGALGCAIIDHLAQANALTLLTTHLGSIKNRVATQPKMENAAVRFNPETLAPEYRLDVGRPGASHALAVAERLGVPAAILTTARSVLQEDQVRLEQVLRDMEGDRDRLNQELDQARTDRAAILTARQKLEKDQHAFRDRRRELMHQAQREAAALVENTRKEMERLLKRLPEAEQEEVKDLRARTGERLRNLRQGIAQTTPPALRPRRKKRQKGGKNIPPALGDSVWIERLQGAGQVVEISGDRVTVDLNGLRVNTRLDELLPLSREQQQEQAAKAAAPAVRLERPRQRQAAQLELNLIGQHIDDALLELDHFLDRALLNGMEQVRIIHGFGSGQLRIAIHQYLKNLPGVLDYRLGRPEKDPGGSGATLVRLET